jgi:hypothetical protein
VAKVTQKINYDSLFHNPRLEQKKQQRLELYQEIRDEVSCCCSWSRYEKINELLDELDHIEIKDILRLEGENR